MKLLLEKD